MRTSGVGVVVGVTCALAGAVAWAGVLDASGQPDATWSGNAMLLWLRADAGITKDASNKVSAWAEQSTHGYVAADANPAFQPVYSAGALNGQDAVVFGAGERLLIAGGPTSHQTLFVVYNDTSTLSWATPLGTTYNGKGSYHGQGNDTGLFSTIYTDPATLNGDNYRNGIDIGDATATPRPDSYALHAYVATGPLSQTVWAVGADQPCCGDRSINGGIAEILLYDRRLNDIEQNAVGHYLANRYGLATTYQDPATMNLGVWNVHDDWDPADGTPNGPAALAWRYQQPTATGYADLPNFNKHTWWTGGNGRMNGNPGYPVVGPRIGDFDHWEPTVDAYIAAHGLANEKLVMMHPGSADSQTAVVTWRNPLLETSVFEFNGVFWHVDDTGTNGVDVSITASDPDGLNDLLLASNLTGLPGDTVTLNAADPNAPDNAPFLFRLWLDPGDEVHFRVNARGEYGSDASMLGLEVRYIPEPASLALLAAGLGLLAARRRRR